MVELRKNIYNKSVKVFAVSKCFLAEVRWTGIQLPVEALENAFRNENPTVYFSDCDCYYYIFDFSFEYNGEKFWIEMLSKENPFVYGMTLNVWQ